MIVSELITFISTINYGRAFISSLGMVTKLSTVSEKSSTTNVVIDVELRQCGGKIFLGLCDRLSLRMRKAPIVMPITRGLGDLCSPKFEEAWVIHLESY